MISQHPFTSEYQQEVSGLSRLDLESPVAIKGSCRQSEQRPHITPQEGSSVDSAIEHLIGWVRVAEAVFRYRIDPASQVVTHAKSLPSAQSFHVRRPMPMMVTDSPLPVKISVASCNTRPMPSELLTGRVVRAPTPSGRAGQILFWILGVLPPVTMLPALSAACDYVCLPGFLPRSAASLLSRTLEGIAS